METLIGKNYLQERIGLGISDNLKSALELALTNIKDSNYISINIIGPENIKLKETQECLDILKKDYFSTFTLSITKELIDKYIIFILKEEC